jgi:multidrug efflux pump subunit AcrB
MALPPEEGRTVSGRQFAHLWQEAFGSSGGLEALNFTGETNITGGEPIMLEVFHPDPEVARAAALSLGERMRLLAGLTSVDDGVRAGKPELTVSVNDRGLLMGMTAEEIALQIRHRFHGMEAYSFIRDNNEIKVMVRLSENQRQRINALDRVLLRSPSGAFIPLAEVAEITQGRSFTSVARRDGRRIYPVTADIGFGIKGDVVEDILENALVPKIVADYPGVSIHFGGEEEENDEALASLGFGFLAVLGGMYLLLVYHFNSAVQPLVVLLTVPFSMVGAVWGHILLGYDLSIVSVIGIIAMAGVVVNDSLVLVTTCNRYCKKGESLVQAVLDSACDRFRPILLTSLTTFFGLTPLLLETSEQAQFLIPAAISISFGLLSGTVVALLLVPGFLVILHSRRSAGTTAPAVVRAVDGEGLSRLV